MGGYNYLFSQSASTAGHATQGVYNYLINNSLYKTLKKHLKKFI